MNPLAIAQLLAQLLPYGVQFANSVIELIHKPNPTLQDWQAALAKAQTPFNSGLQPGVLIPDVPPRTPLAGGETVTIPAVTVPVLPTTATIPTGTGGLPGY
jgi:hypothetical protein